MPKFINCLSAQALVASIVLLPASVAQHSDLSFSIGKLGRIAIPAFGIPTMEFPLLLSIGFIAGNILLMPLTVGLISKIFLLNPVHEQFFDYLKYNDFFF